MAKTIRREQGVMMVLLAILLPAVIGFAALAIDVGYWYLLRAELSKSVDAAALAAAKNVGNTAVLNSIVTNVGRENFSRSPLGAGLSPTFIGTQDAANQTYSVTGTVVAPRWFAYFIGPLTITKAAKVKMKKKEIMLVLDDSGSMSSAVANLRTAARGFVANFTNTQAFDRLGLVIFGTTASTRVALNTNTVTAIDTAIAGMRANSGNTNTDDALELAKLAPFSSGQLALPAEQRIAQFVVFFTDGQPTRFSDRFRYNGVDMICLVSPPTSRNSTTVTDVAITPSASDPDCSLTVPAPINTTGNVWESGGGTYNLAGAAALTNGVYPAGDGGKRTGTPLTQCCSTCPAANQNQRYLNVRWYIFSDTDLGINPGSRYNTTGTDYTGNYAFTDASPPTIVNLDQDCRNATTELRFLPRYVFDLKEDLPLSHATALKNAGIKVYSIGLGTVNAAFLQELASDPDSQYYFYADTPDKLDDIFNLIARDVEVRLAE